MGAISNSIIINTSIPKNRFAAIFLMTGYMMFVFSAAILFLALSYDFSLIRNAAITFLSGVPIATIGIIIFFLSETKSIFH